MSDYDKDWDWYANLIDSHKESLEWTVIRRTRETHWEKFCHIQSGENVLGVGCGHGDYTRLLLLKGAKVWAFDYAKNMVAATESRLARAALKTEKLTVDSVLDIPYPDKMFGADGGDWKREGRIALRFKDENDYATSRPFVLRENGIYRMWHSHRDNAYRNGYAESENASDRERMDEKVGITVSDSGWDSETVEYPFLFDHKGQRYMLYNGNGYGRTGFGLAVLE